MSTQKFFDESSEQSQVKAAIVAKYFSAWSKVIVPWAKKGPGRIAYIDLFAGPGRYADGRASTPLLVLEQAIKDPSLRDMLVTQFNDVDDNHTQTLRAEIAKLPGIETLRHAPKVHNEEVGENVVREFEAAHLVPTLFFVDPWGYKRAVLATRELGSQGLGVRLHLLLQLQPDQYGAAQ